MSNPVARIAGILDGALDDPGVIDNVDVAHLLVRELGLRPEWGALDEEYSGTLADTRGELEPWSSEAIYHRYITDWTKDE